LSFQQTPRLTIMFQKENETGGWSGCWNHGWRGW